MQGLSGLGVPNSLRLVPLTIIFHAAGQETCTENAEGTLARSRAADDFPAIRARMEELKRERDGTKTDDDTLRRMLPCPMLPMADPGRRTDQEYRLSCAELC